MKNLVDNVVKHETKKRDDLFDFTSRKLENWKKTYAFWDTPDDGKVRCSFLPFLFFFFYCDVKKPFYIQSGRT